MPELIHSIVAITSSRDRTDLHSRLADLLVAHYSPVSARRLHFDGKKWRLMWALGESNRTLGSPSGVNVRQEVLERMCSFHRSQAPWLSVFPLSDTEVLELEYESRAAAGTHRIADYLFEVHQNLLRLFDYGERDSLTGLFNRKTFDETFSRLLKHPERNLSLSMSPARRRHLQDAEPCWIAVIDIDHFKRVNDAYGHLVGDQVLALVAKLMLASFRLQDRLYRFGGEEFVVLMTCPDAKSMRTAMERFRQKVASFAFPSVGRLTVSAGFTRVLAQDTSMSAFERADKAVYVAKGDGRNQTVNFDDISATVAGDVDVPLTSSACPNPDTQQEKTALEGTVAVHQSVSRSGWVRSPVYLWCLLLISVLPACADPDLADTAPRNPQPSSLVRLAVEAPGAHCAAGGTRLLSGVDSNGNNALDDEEVISSQFVCNGRDGLIGSDGSDGSDGRDGANGRDGREVLIVGKALIGDERGCVNGGVLYLVGLDLDLDRVLQDEEVTETASVCNGSPGSVGAKGPAGFGSLIRSTPVLSGPDCPSGGVRVAAGLDRNQDDILEDVEISSNALICNGLPGLMSLISQSSVPAGPQCELGGVRISSGLDFNTDGLLQSSEVSAESFVCTQRAQGGLHWEVARAPEVQGVPNAGYIVDSAQEVAVRLPATGALSIGDQVAVTGIGTGGWRIVQAEGQQIELKGVRGANAGVNWRDVSPDRSNWWTSISSSDDGRVLLLGSWSGPLFLSRDAGTSWTEARGRRAWSGAASSADGQRLLAADMNGLLHVSVDGGFTWSERAFRKFWSAVASSSDGQRLAAAASGDSIFGSIDGGLSWLPTNAPVADWKAIASSSDGRFLVAAATGLPLQVSADGGLTWNAREVGRTWSGVACSADCSIIAATVSDDYIYVSRDSGQSWRSVGPSAPWSAITSSVDSTRMLASTSDGRLYASTDQGATWSQRLNRHSANWRAIACSADGGQLLAVNDSDSAVLLSTLTTSLGVDGGVLGGQYDGVTLQFIGSGKFMVWNHTGNLGYR